MDKHKQITSYLNNLVKQFNKGKKQSTNQFKNNDMTSTGKLKRENKIIGLQIFENNIYKETIYSRKVSYLKQYAKDNNIFIILNNSHYI